MDETPLLEVTVAGIAAGWVSATDCRVAPSDADLLATIARDRASAVGRKDSPDSAARKAMARDMLRFGAYKPTGRGKPASEYLLNAAVEGDFPLIANLVDINNLVSLDALLPVSLVDLERAGTRSFRVRRGRAGESYSFNASGQVLELHDLLLLAMLPDDVPCASPVKDSHATKVHPGTREVFGVIFAPLPLAEEARKAARRMAELIARHAGGRTESGLAAPPFSP